MLNLLVAVDRSLEASFALRTACLFGLQIRIRPIYVVDPPGRDISFGAGWAWKSWERETRAQAKSYIEDLVQAERNQCTNIEDPVVLMGDPVQELAGYFWKNPYEMLVIGAPFRGVGPLVLSRRFMQAAKKARRDLPLLIVRHLKGIQKVVALTDGGEAAERALGMLVRANAHLPSQITLIGLPEDAAGLQSEALNLERGLAILREKRIKAEGLTVSALGPEKLSAMLKASDLAVSPYFKHDRHMHLHELMDEELQAVLVYISRE
jgi:hypothetical protein